ncbi:MAG: hypothetical protein RLN85_18505, partial [Pseudomonadales bacterium]
KNDYEKAKVKLQEYAACKARKAEEQNRMKELELDLKEFSEENKNLFDENGTLEFPEVGKLRFASKSTINRIKKTFSAVSFFSKYRHFCDITIPVAGIRKAIQDPEVAQELKEAGVTLKVTEEFKIEC